MRRDDLLRRVQERPFRPFYLRLSSGAVHFIRHPEGVMVLGSSVMIGMPRPVATGPNDFDDYAVVSLSHVEQIDPVSSLPDAKPKDDDNGF